MREEGRQSRCRVEGYEEGGRYFGGEGRARAEVLEEDVAHLRQEIRSQPSTRLA